MSFPPFRWNAKLFRYISPGGLLVSDVNIRQSLQFALAKAEDRTRGVALRLRNREIAISEYAVEMRVIIKDTQLYSSALASGGWAQMTPRLYGAAGRRIRTQYEFLSRTLTQIRTGQMILDGNFIHWSSMYATSAWSTWSAMRSIAARDAGKTIEWNVLGKAEHCRGCLDQTARGRVPIGTLIPVGERPCLSSDQCHLEYE